MRRASSDKFFPIMESMTVQSVREYLERKQSIVLPIGVIEQHGYHLPLNTDALIATRLGRRIGERTDILVAPTLHQSFSGGGLPGTVNISPAVMSLVVGDMLISLVAQGFRNFYLFLCHGGSENTRALGDTVRMLLRNNPAFQRSLIALLPVWKLDPHRIAWQKAIAEGDWHAGWLETSMVLAIDPGLVRMDAVAVDEEPYRSLQIRHPDNYQRAEKIVDDPFVIPRMTQRPEIKVGVMGHPERASAEIGKAVNDTIVDAASAKILELEAKADGVYRDVDFIPEPLILTEEPSATRKAGAMRHEEETVPAWREAPAS